LHFVFNAQKTIKLLLFIKISSSALSSSYIYIHDFVHRLEVSFALLHTRYITPIDFDISNFYLLMVNWKKSLETKMETKPKVGLYFESYFNIPLVSQSTF